MRLDRRALVWALAGVIVAAVAAVTWLSGAMDHLPDPVVDRGVEEAWVELRASPTRETRPLIIFLGDSRYRALLRVLGERRDRWKVQTITVGERDVDVFSVAGRGVQSFADFEPMLDDLLGRRPDVVVIQPEMVAPGEDWERELRLGDQAARLGRRKGKRSPNAGRSGEVARALVERAAAQGTVVVAVKLPISSKWEHEEPERRLTALRSAVMGQLSLEADRYIELPARPVGDFADDGIHLVQTGARAVLPEILERVVAALGPRGEAVR